MKRVLIIGAGVYGSLAKKVLLDMGGLEITLIDSKEPYSASKCALGIMKPSWLSGFINLKQYKHLVGVLDKLVGVEKIDLCYQDGKPFHTFNRVNVQRDVLEAPDIVDKVTSINFDSQFIVLASGTKLSYDFLYIATGFWVNQLLPSAIDIEALWGVTYVHDEVVEPSIRIYQPFKQVIAYPKNETQSYVIDGATVTTDSDVFFNVIPNWLQSKQKQNASLVGINTPPSEKLFGIRPKTTKFPNGVFGLVGNNAWCGTGGAKNGTIAAIKAAIELSKEIGEKLNG